VQPGRVVRRSAPCRGGYVRAEPQRRIAKTLFLLAYIDDEAFRRRMLVQLNRGEGRHRLARAVFHGQRGELRQRYREGQEDQLGALGLVVNAIILWNTRYIERALTQLELMGLDVRPEDVERIWRSAFSTSTCRAATHSTCPNNSHVASCARCAIRQMPLTKRSPWLRPVYRSIATQHPVSTEPPRSGAWSALRGASSEQASAPRRESDSPRNRLGA
jgi:hypothetical protein